ncbi:Conserved putative membrane protein [Candidatus Protochlamydia naegleriophila]|uniref:Conserved putative membrane protein n=1 Tax=Candidatus Protochlamydia naegleriophila TaxID=389348 RepID=A0A0U5JA57_9BACT|nr:hypothetical protein [Candidatus Protochlamydia naegleriophila]CUI15668.1 Conserved putative membrane protein [Candidatus Protochlamydia naegleriophila]
MKILAVVDGFGIYGNLLHYSFVISIVGSSFLVFFYLWKKGRLGMDEEAKYQMMNEEADLQRENQHDTKR